jgi:hypothetical protein
MHQVDTWTFEGSEVTLSVDSHGLSPGFREVSVSFHREEGGTTVSNFVAMSAKDAAAVAEIIKYLFSDMGGTALQAHKASDAEVLPGES